MIDKCSPRSLVFRISESYLQTSGRTLQVGEAARGKRYMSIAGVGSESMSPAFEKWKEIHALGRAATVSGPP